MSNVDVMKVLIITGNSVINVIHVSEGILSGNLVYKKHFRNYYREIKIRNHLEGAISWSDETFVGNG